MVTYTVVIVLNDGTSVYAQATGTLARRSLFLGANDWLDNHQDAEKALFWNMFADGHVVEWSMYDA